MSSLDSKDTSLAELLTPKKALIFRITHRNNVPWILTHGLHCRNSEVADPKFVSIGNEDLIDKRAEHVVKVPPGGTLGDYIPFYFTPFSPMLFNIKTGWGGIRKRSNEEIVILVSSLYELASCEVRFLITDRHAYLRAATYSADLAEVTDLVPWQLLRARDFKKDPNDPGKLERYQAEALAHAHVPVDALLGIICYTEEVRSEIDRRCAEQEVAMRVMRKASWYFR